MSSEDTASIPRELLLCIFIHGFKGTNETFSGFPTRLQHILAETVPHVVVECIVTPLYETKGELNIAVERFADWLTTLTVEKEVAHGAGGGAGKAKIVLCGHSMGGLLAADTFLAMANSRPVKSAPLWPNIIACLAFDTPYLGVHPLVFKNGATKAMGYVQTARDIASGVGTLGALGAGLGFGKKASRPDPAKGKDEEEFVAHASSSADASTSRSVWGKWGSVAYGVGGVMLAGAVAGAAYHRRSDVTSGWAWAGDHLKYVKNLWDEKALKERLVNLVAQGEDIGVVFRTFYTYLPGNPPTNPEPRTFIVLPPEASGYARYFVRVHNGLAVDEVSAHTGMFEASSNDGYYEFGLQTAEAIREAMTLDRSSGKTDADPVASATPAKEEFPTKDGSL